MDKNEELLEWQSKIEESTPLATTKRVLVKAKGKIPDDALRGRVIAVKGRSYLVGLLEDYEIEFYECHKAGTIISQYENSSLVAVGDYVFILPGKRQLQENIGKGTIIAIEERFSFLSRTDLRTPAERLIAANIEHLVIMASARQPRYNKRLIDRLLVAAELGNLEPIICLNKIDLGDKNKIKDDLSVYYDLDIELFLTSFNTNEGVSDIKDFLKERSSVLIGSSGVGKSTLINSLLGKNVQKISDISKKTSKGKHTTSFIRMFNLGDSGEIIDTPGIREFGIFGLEPEELTLYFHDFDEYYENCRFMPCTHTHEPDCRIKEAVENNEIDEERYESYLNIFESLNIKKY